MAASGKPGTIKRFLTSLGPGLITGAADDDPAGITTYSIAGAQFGTAFFWSPLLTWPLMVSAQMMSARIGMTTGAGLADAMRKKFPRWVVAVTALALLAANTFNIGADLAGMADAAEMLTGLHASIYVVLFGLGISIATVELRYATIARVLKWLTVFLFAYVITAFYVRPDWTEILRAVTHPKLPHGSEAWGMAVAILGTTISPYLFFWQTSEEVEEERSLGRTSEAERAGATEDEIRARANDVGFGTFAANIIMFFVIVTTALTLHAHGVTKIETSRQAAEALRPLAGDACFFLYAIGIVAVGLLAIPTLSGSAAYALSETFGWPEGLDEKVGRARAFYTVVVLAVMAGIAFDFTGVNPIRALYWSAVINGVLAPFVLVAMLLVAGDSSIMHGQPSSRASRAVVALTAAVMTGAAIALFVV